MRKVNQIHSPYVKLEECVKGNKNLVKTIANCLVISEQQVLNKIHGFDDFTLSEGIKLSELLGLTLDQIFFNI